MADLTKDEWCRRFVVAMTAMAPAEFADGSSVAEYAEETAPLYWGEPDQRADGPEACASADMDCWELEGEA